MHYFHLTDNDTRLTWMSKDNKNRSVRLTDVEEVLPLMGSPLFEYRISP